MYIYISIYLCIYISMGPYGSQGPGTLGSRTKGPRTLGSRTKGPRTLGSKGPGTLGSRTNGPGTLGSRTKGPGTLGSRTKGPGTLGWLLSAPGSVGARLDTPLTNTKSNDFFFVSILPTAPSLPAFVHIRIPSMYTTIESITPETLRPRVVFLKQVSFSLQGSRW